MGMGMGTSCHRLATGISLSYKSIVGATSLVGWCGFEGFQYEPELRLLST